MQTFLVSRIAIAILMLSSARLGADTVDVKGGARSVGKVTKTGGGSVVVSTDYAGTITIKQSEVTAITTDGPIAVRLANGTRVDGRVSGGGNGALQIVTSDGTIA